DMADSIAGRSRQSVAYTVGRSVAYTLGGPTRVTTMVNYISGLVFAVLLLLGILITGMIGQEHVPMAALFGLVWLFLDVVIASAIRLAAQWERAVVFRLGKFHSLKGPGLFLIIPLIDQLRMVDTRVLAVNIPKQQVITRDNVPVTIDAV